MKKVTVCLGRKHEKISKILFTEERQRAEGRKYNFCPLLKGFRASKFIYEKKKKYVFRDAQRIAFRISLWEKKYYVPIESPKFIYGVSLLPSQTRP
ncbi:MAG: hypothetical protein V7K97_29835 [Nostoc sp.]|uniref:hypothetical protein n=1 Tax=Nostoc sp. TaxID=1180 RepID=UPI002FF8B6E4